ncbi:hypothetical protein GCM10023087_07960 [Microbacterium rhizosphaerae]
MRRPSLQRNRRLPRIRPTAGDARGMRRAARERRYKRRTPSRLWGSRQGVRASHCRGRSKISGRLGAAGDSYDYCVTASGYAKAIVARVPFLGDIFDRNIS